MAGTDKQVQGIPGVRDRRVQATKVRLYHKIGKISTKIHDIGKIKVIFGVRMILI